MSSITTTARRITRTLNAARSDARITFDADGHEIGRVYGPDPYAADGGIVMAARCINDDRTPRRWTQRDAQNVLDEVAAERAEGQTR